MVEMANKSGFRIFYLAALIGAALRTLRNWINILIAVYQGRGESREKPCGRGRFDLILNLKTNLSGNIPSADLAGPSPVSVGLGRQAAAQRGDRHSS